MPATASYVAGDPSLRERSGVRRLNDPGLSLELGQRYLLHLVRHEVVGDDLIRLLAAYNAGPGNLARWLPSNGHRDDPFLFIESLPIPETRVNSGTEAVLTSTPTALTQSSTTASSERDSLASETSCWY